VGKQQRRKEPEPPPEPITATDLRRYAEVLVLRGIRPVTILDLQATSKQPPVITTLRRRHAGRD